jgi:hypothetical protein
MLNYREQGAASELGSGVMHESVDGPRQSLWLPAGTLRVRQRTRLTGCRTELRTATRLGILHSTRRRSDEVGIAAK